VFSVWADLLSVDQAAGRRAGGLLHGRGEGVGPRHPRPQASGPSLPPASKMTDLHRRPRRPLISKIGHQTPLYFTQDIPCPDTTRPLLQIIILATGLGEHFIQKENMDYTDFQKIKTDRDRTREGHPPEGAGHHQPREPHRQRPHRGPPNPKILRPELPTFNPKAVQGYLAHKKTHPQRSLQQPYA